MSGDLAVGALAAAGLLIGLVKTGFGIGSGILFTPVLALLLPPAQAVGWLAPVQLLTDCLAVSAHWRRWDGCMARLLLPAALVGTAVGSAVLAWAPAAWVRRAIGLLALLFVAQQWARAHRKAASGAPPGPRPWLAVSVGLAGGITSAIAHAGGIVLSVYMLPRMEKTAFVSTLNLMLFILNAVKLVLYWQLGIMSRADLVRSLWLIPLLGLGSWVGGIVHRHLSQRRFMAVATGLVALTGLALVLR